MKLDLDAYNAHLAQARLQLSGSWQTTLHPRGAEGRFIDVAGAMAAGASENQVVQSVMDHLYKVPQEQAAEFDANGVKISKAAGRGRFKDERGQDLGFPSTASHRVVRMAIERTAARQRQQDAAAPKAKKGVIQHKLPDGTIAQRRTARPYTHVITIQHDGKRVVRSWHQSEANARKDHVRASQIHKDARVEKIQAP